MNTIRKTTLSLMCCLLAACGERAAEPLRIVGAASALPLPTASQLVLLCSEAIDSNAAQDTLLLSDVDGRLIDCSYSTEGPHLIMTPRGEIFSAEHSPYTVALAWPPVGPQLRSKRGQTADTAWRLQFQVNAQAHSCEEMLLLTPTNAWPTPLRVGDTAGAPVELQLNFTAPLDTRTLHAGIQVIDEQRHEALDAVEFEVLPDQPQRVLLRPFTRNPWLLASGTYRVEVGAALRSLHGVPVRPAQRRFQLSGAPRLLQFDFTQRDDVTGAARDAVQRDGVLRPRPLYHPVLPTPQSGGLVPLGDDRGTTLFPRAPHGVKAQLLLPGHWLASTASGESTQRRMLITEIDLLADAPVPMDLCAADLQVRLGLLRRDPARRIQLSERFDANCTPNSLRLVQLRDSNGITQLGGGADGTPDRLIRLRLQDPWVYDVDDGDLVLTIEHDGVWSQLVPLPERGLSILGMSSDGQSETSEGTTALVMGLRGANSATLTSSLQAHVWLQTLSFESVETRWHVVTDAKNPVFSREPEHHARAEAVEGQDFTVWFQGGKARRDTAGQPLLHADGSVQVDPTGPYDLVPPRGNGDALRARIEFEPSGRLLRQAPTIEYILVAYRDA